MKKLIEELRLLCVDLSTIHKFTEIALIKCEEMFDLFYNHIEMMDTGDYTTSVTTSEKSDVNNTSMNVIAREKSEVNTTTDTSTNMENKKKRRE